MSLTQLLVAYVFLFVIFIIDYIKDPPDIDNFENF